MVHVVAQALVHVMLFSANAATVPVYAEHSKRIVERDGKLAPFPFIYFHVFRTRCCCHRRD